ncbi:hypothetical protein ACOME3_001952 [Neoechinorhynchus agilis]
MESANESTANKLEQDHGSHFKKIDRNLSDFMRRHGKHRHSHPDIKLNEKLLNNEEPKDYSREYLQELIDAEQEARLKITEARKRYINRLKEADMDADEELKKFEMDLQNKTNAWRIENEKHLEQCKVELERQGKIDMEEVKHCFQKRKRIAVHLLFSNITGHQFDDQSSVL